MKAKFAALEETYTKALRDYLISPSAVTLAAAQAVGRAFLELGAGIREIADAHLKALAVPGLGQSPDAGTQAARFLTEALLPCDKKLRAGDLAQGDLTRSIEQLQAENAEYRLANEKLAEARSIMESVLEASDACICLKDKEGRFLYVNQRFEAVFRRSRADIVGKIRAGLVPGDFVADFLRSDLHVL
jgi:PAS domain-containing protein